MYFCLYVNLCLLLQFVSCLYVILFLFFFFQAEDGIRDTSVTGVQTCALPISAPVETKDLADYLREQVRLLDLTPRQQLLAEEFIGNIAEDGYLGATLEEIARGANQVLEEYAVESEQEVQPQLYTLAEAEEILRIIQKLDPPGVGARDLRECLLLQLEDQKKTDTLAYRLVQEAFDDLKAHRWSDLG